MNRVGRMPFLILLGGALLLPLAARAYAQDKDNQDAPADKQQDSGKKGLAKKTKNLKKARKGARYPLQEVAGRRSPLHHQRRRARRVPAIADQRRARAIH